MAVKIRWSDELFDVIAGQTNLGESTLAACREVLVPQVGPNGVVTTGRGAKAAIAAKHGFEQSHLSRALSQLQAKLIEFGDLSDPTDLSLVKGAMQVERMTSRDVAVQRAREMMPNLLIQEPKAGQLYIGKPLVKTDQYLVQLTGGVSGTGEGLAVLHDLSRLQRLPDMNIPGLEIKYPSKGGLATVEQTVLGQTRGGRSL